MFDIEKSLIKKSQDGDMDAFEKLILKYEKKIYNIAYHMFHNEQDAYDIAQEVFIKVWKNIDSFNYTSKFSTWLHRITINTSIDEIRKKKKKPTDSMDELIELGESKVEKQYTNEALTPEEKVLKKENESELFDLINKLKENHKAIIILRDIKGYSYEEISEILDCSIGTVKSRLSRARLKLKEIYIENMEQNQKKFVE